jgi:hypothetical protein
MRDYLVKLQFLFVAVMLLSCSSSLNHEEGDVPADVVYNPNSANDTEKKDLLPVLTFEEAEHDFGQVMEGETVSFLFKFRNTGKTDLIITEVSTSCGCTVPTFPKMPIKPGDGGSIKIAFNSQGRRGYQSKNILVVANTQPNISKLLIKAQVVGPKQIK